MAMIDFKLLNCECKIDFWNATFCDGHKELFYVFDKRKGERIKMVTGIREATSTHGERIVNYHQFVRLPIDLQKYFLVYYKITSKVASVEIYSLYLGFLQKNATFLIDLKDKEHIKYVLTIIENISFYPDIFKKVNRVVFDNFVFNNAKEITK